MSSAGSGRSANRCPTERGSAIRSTRKVRQSAAVDVEGHQVPAATPVHQAVRLDAALGRRAGVVGIAAAASPRGRARRRR